MSPRIVVDENIPLAHEAFSRFGEVELHPGRSISPEIVADAEFLIVRSITRVDQALLSGSRVRFVGTATIGTDHIDLEYLRQRGIAFADAAGSNANSVAEWITAALLDLEAVLGTSFDGKILGVVGIGNVGSKVVRKAEALGMEVLKNDPPRMEVEGHEGYVSLEKLLAEADVVTLHTPLTKATKYPTFHLVGPDQLRAMKVGAVLLNTSRGAVVDTHALLQSLERGHLAGAGLDVWENEPHPDPNLLAKTRIATPHIAGYSLDGKIGGTRMMVEALSRFLGEPPGIGEDIFEIPVPQPNIHLLSTGREALREAVFAAYPIQEDDRRMRETLTLEDRQWGKAFDTLRKEYPVRREFHNYAVQGEYLSPEDRESLAALGFRVPGASDRSAPR